MKRNLITVMLLVCSILLMAGGVVFYRSLSENVPDDVLPTAGPTEIPEVLSPEEITPEPEIIIPGNEGTGEEPGIQPGSEAEIIPDDPSLELAHDFTMLDRDGQEHKLSEFYGKPIIINIWATWCGPCQMELPHFNEACQKYGDKIQFIMLDLTDGSYETRDGTIAFAENMGYSFPLFFDEMGEGSQAYDVQAIPLTIVINAYGRIVDSHLGSMSSEELQALIDKVLY